MTDFSGRLYLEQLSVAARENTLTAAIAWLLSKGSELHLDERLGVLSKLTGLDYSEGERIEVQTEWKNVDLLVAICTSNGTSFVAFEHKTKSQESDGQLAKYDQILAGLDGTVAKLFLTVNGEAPASGSGWKPVSYCDLIESIPAVLVEARPFSRDLQSTFVRLYEAHKMVEYSAEAAASVFDELTADAKNDFTCYVGAMHLKKALQKHWMRQLVSILNLEGPWNLRVDETNGTALIDIYAPAEEPGFRNGVQIQGRSMKAFCVPEPYPREASISQNQTVIDILQRMRNSSGGGANFTKSRKRGFRSFAVGKVESCRELPLWKEEIERKLATILLSFGHLIQK